MSMSQEEIEALMSGADDMYIDEDDNDDSLEEEIVLQDEDSSLSHIDNDYSPSEESIDEIDVDDILAGIDGIVDDKTPPRKQEKNDDKIANDVEDMDAKINSSQYPMPVSDENKVVNQLNEVADDSEAKASQIFDVLSFILDENSEISKYNKNMSEFIEKQSELLNSLATKFPNVSIFSENLLKSQELLQSSRDLSAKVDAENNKVFEAMELMQYHDINRQKIERVMAVIKKLSNYLNGIFEDQSEKPEVQIAKHISGDSNDIVNANDIESLIAEFSK